MKKIPGAFVLVSILSCSLFAQRLQVRLVSSAYAWERQDTVGVSSQHLFGYQTVQLSLAGKDVAFYSYVQGFNDFTGPAKNDPLVRLYNLYVRWSNIANVADLSVGRQAVYAGVGNGTVDGGMATIKLFDTRLKMVGYYGLLPAPRQKAELIGDKKNNFMTGAQLLVSPVEFADLTLSYMKRNIKPETYIGLRRDSLFNPYPVEIKPSATAEEYLSADASLEYGGWISGYARYDYDVLQEKMSRVQFFARVKPFESFAVKALQPFGLTAEYVQREPRLQFNSIFTVFAYNTLKEYEVGGEYAITPMWQVFAKYGSVSYGDEDSKRVTVGVNGDHISASVTRNVGYAGELSAASASFGYPLFENKLMPTLMASFAQYKLSESASKLNDALSVGLGLVFRPIPVLSLDAQGQWIQNKIYKNDIRLFVRASYLFSQQLGLF